MSHWTENYIGRRYEKNVYDCASLVMDVQRDVFGRDVPDYGTRPDLRSAQHALLAEEAARLTRRVDVPHEGDAVQILVSGTITHVGVYVNIDGEGWVLHNIKKLGVILTRVRDLARYSWRLEGYYAWK